MTTTKTMKMEMMMATTMLIVFRLQTTAMGTLCRAETRRDGHNSTPRPSLLPLEYQLNAVTVKALSDDDGDNGGGVAGGFRVVVETVTTFHISDFIFLMVLAATVTAVVAVAVVFYE